jgi:hypothetical protein
MVVVEPVLAGPRLQLARAMNATQPAASCP